MRTSPPRKNTEAGRSPAVNKSGSLGIHYFLSVRKGRRGICHNAHNSEPSFQRCFFFQRGKWERTERPKTEAAQDVLGGGQIGVGGCGGSFNIRSDRRV